MRHSKLIAMLALTGISTCLADAPSGAADISGFSAQYEARYAAFSGDITMDLRTGDTADEYVYRVSTQARGLAKLVRSGTATETARFRYEDGAIVPLDYEIDDGTRAGDDDMLVSFDWDTGVANSTYEKESTTLELAPDIRDRLTTDLHVMQQLRKGAAPKTFRIAEKNAIRDYELTFIGDATIDVPAGQFATVKYLRQRVGSSRATIIWFAPALDYLPVRLEQQKRGKTSITTVATSVSLDRL
jgi:hypothetical protein